MKKGILSILTATALLAMGSLAGCSGMQANSPESQPAATDTSEQKNAEAAKPVAADSGKTENTAPATQSAPEPMTLEQAQARLNELGFNVGKVDGLIGPKTRAGLKHFQKERGIPITGELDPTTINELRIK